MSYTLRAMIVGIDEYKLARQQKVSKLQCARHDALEIARVFRASSVLHLDAAHLHLLTDEQASKRTLYRAKDDCFFSRTIDDQTISLFYFAGHGIVKNDQVYLCGHDVDFASPDEQGGIPLDAVYDWLYTGRAKCSIAIIDSCFSGGLTTQSSRYVTAAEKARQAIENVKPKEGRTIAIMAACGSNQQAREDLVQKHGIFTQQLLLGLRDGEACDRDGTVTLTGLINHLEGRFIHDPQKPRFSFTSSGPIVLGRVTPPPHQARKAPRTLDQPPAQPDGMPPLQLPVLRPAPRPATPNRGHNASDIPDIEIPVPDNDELPEPGPSEILKPSGSNVNVKRILILLGLLLLFCIIVYMSTRHG